MNYKELKEMNKSTETLAKPYTPSIMAIPKAQWETFLEAVVTCDLHIEILYEKTLELITAVENLQSKQNSQETKIDKMMGELPKLDIREAVSAEHENMIKEAEKNQAVTNEIATKMKYFLIGAIVSTILSICFQLFLR